MTIMTPIRSEEAEIRRTIETYAEGVRHKDAGLALDAFDEHPVVFNLAPPLRQSGDRAESRRELETWFATWNGPIAYELRDVAVVADGDLALAHGFLRIGGDKIGEGPISVWARLTLGLARRGGRWRIVHEHSSTPFHMDGSLRAAVDLEPVN